MVDTAKYKNIPFLIIFVKIQKQLSKKRKNKTYYKYVVIIPREFVKKSKLEGHELEADVSEWEIKLKKKR